MSGETQLLMEQLVDAVKRTQEYNQYQTLLENVRKRPEIYQRSENSAAEALHSR